MANQHNNQYSIAYKIEQVEASLASDKGPRAFAAGKPYSVTSLHAWRKMYKEGALKHSNAIAVSSKPAQVIKPVGGVSYLVDGLDANKKQSIYKELDAATTYAKQLAYEHPGEVYEIVEISRNVLSKVRVNLEWLS